MRNSNKNGTSEAALGLGAVLLMVTCCAAGPALIAAGTLGAIGRFLGSPFVIAAAVILSVIGLTAALHRRGSAQCCPPVRRPQGVAHRPDSD